MNLIGRLNIFHEFMLWLWFVNFKLMLDQSRMALVGQWTPERNRPFQSVQTQQINTQYIHVSKERGGMFFIQNTIVHHLPIWALNSSREDISIYRVEAYLYWGLIKIQNFIAFLSGNIFPILNYHPKKIQIIVRLLEHFWPKFIIHP